MCLDAAFCDQAHQVNSGWWLARRKVAGRRREAGPDGMGRAGFTHSASRPDETTDPSGAARGQVGVKHRSDSLCAPSNGGKERVNFAPGLEPAPARDACFPR